MGENARRREHAETTCIPRALPSEDERHASPTAGWSVSPPDAVSHARAADTARAFSDATLEKLGLEDLQESYGRAIDGAESRRDPPGPETWASPMDVVREQALSLDAKRSILISWAWTEYLIDQATNEGMPENSRPSRLDEVERALLALEREVSSNCAASSRRKAA